MPGLTDEDVVNLVVTINGNELVNAELNLGLADPAINAALAAILDGVQASNRIRIDKLHADELAASEAPIIAAQAQAVDALKALRAG